MGWFQQLRQKAANVISGTSEGQQNQYFESLLQRIGFGGTVWKNADDRKLIKEGYQTNVDLFSVIDYMTDKAGTVKWRLMRRLPDGKTEEVTDVKHPVKKLWDNPNKETNSSLFVQEQLAFKYITGDRYMYGIRAGENRPFTELYTMAPSNVEIVTQSPELEGGLIKGYQLTGTWDKLVDPEKVKHGKTFNPDHDSLNMLYGQSPLQAAGVVIQRSNESYLTSYKNFKNMGANGAMIGDGEWAATPEEIKKMRKRYQNEYGGGENANGVMWLPGKNMQWINFGLSPADLEVLKSQNFDLERFANLYHMPIQLFNQERTYNDNMRQAKKDAWNDAILPPLNELLQDINEWFLPAWSKELKEDLFFELDISGIAELQGDIGEMVKWLVLMHDRGLITGNTFLKTIGMPEGDAPMLNDHRVRLQSGLTVPIEDSGIPPALPPASGA